MSTGGIHGTDAESCVVCLRGTDTALAFVGEAEWAVAGLQHLGVPDYQAGATVSYGLGCGPGEVPDGEVTVMFRVCRECADKAGFPVALVTAAADIPAIRQK